MDNQELNTIRLLGTDEPLNSVRHLSIGAFSFDIDNGQIRYLRWDGVELLRGIAYLLRDSDWGTVTAQVNELKTEKGPDVLLVRFLLTMRAGEHDLSARVEIRATSNGVFQLEVKATADGPILTNRCGLVVLHPATLAGQPLHIMHTNGDITETTFPELISPCQPAFDIRTLSFNPTSGLFASCQLEAELPNDPAGKFEMEDQRNWSDASFKTYVGSLLDVWPYTLPTEVPLTQKLSLVVKDTRFPSNSQPIQDLGFNRTSSVLELGNPTGVRLPEIGVGVPHGAHRATPADHEALIRLRPQVLVVEAELEQPDLLEHLNVAVAWADATGSSIQLDIIPATGCDPKQCAALALNACQEIGLKPSAIRAIPRPYLQSYQPNDVWPEVAPLEAYAEALKQCFPDARIGGGMVTYFTELNRKRQTSEHIDFIGHATCPIVHAADDLSVMETLECLPHIQRSVQALWPQLGYRIGPSSIAASRNPYGKQPVSNPLLRRIPLSECDPRHQAQFGAAWTAGYAAALVPEGIELLAIHHSHGLSSLALANNHPDWTHGAVIPAWFVLHCLSHYSGLELLQLKGLPDGTAGLAWIDSKNKRHAMVANLQATSISIAFINPMSQRILDINNYQTAGLLPIETGTLPWLNLPNHISDVCKLPPYAVALLTE